MLEKDAQPRADQGRDQCHKRLLVAPPFWLEVVIWVR